MDNILELASKVETEYKEGLQYKKQMGFLHNWAEYERFKAGDQWPAATEKTKNLPRPVFNIIRQVQNHKVASVMNENIKMVFTAQDVEPEIDEAGNQIDPPEVEAADKFTRYADTTWENMKQDQLNEEALESAANVGTGIWHYYWDSSISGGNSLKYVGDIAGEVLDPVNYFPGNPQNKDVQKQPYNIITHRDLVANVREEARNNGISDEYVLLIRADSETEDQAYDMAKKELTNSDKVTVITKYWKENGEIYFMKVASGIVIKPATNTKMKRYPLVVMQWDRRKKSVFGIGDTEGLIPNQKAINFLMAMQLLSVQLTGWPKLAVDKTYIKQQISNTPGEVINVSGVQTSIDQAIKYLNPATMPAHVPALVDSFIAYTKEVVGANENALGEQNSSQLNATAIMLLQKASGVPIESIKRRFYQAMEDVGLVWSEFWKVYYNTDRMVSLEDDDGEQYSEVFNGSDYADVDMRLKIDIGPSSSYSESLMMTSLDKLFDNQFISLEQYLKYAPKNVIPFKDRLLREIQVQQEQAAQQQQQMVMQEILSMMPPEQQQSVIDEYMASQQQQTALPPTPQMM
jgi:hypothetical protein